MADKTIGVTLKQDKGYDAPWITVSAQNADEARRHLAEIIGLDHDLAERLTLADLTVHASQQLQAVGNVATKLGGEVISYEKPEKDPPFDGGKPVGASEDAWKQAEQQTPARKGKAKKDEEPAEEGDGILAQIARAASVKSLRQVWARHKAAWNDEYTEAMKARKEELAA